MAMLIISPVRLALRMPDPIDVLATKHDLFYYFSVDNSYSFPTSLVIVGRMDATEPR